MARKKERSIRCPTCRGPVMAGGADFPFCSGRCRLLDLGKWASDGYVISTPILDPERFENMPEGERHGPDETSFREKE